MYPRKALAWWYAVGNSSKTADFKFAPNKTAVGWFHVRYTHGHTCRQLQVLLLHLYRFRL